MRIFSLSLILLFSLFIFTENAYAKVLPQAHGSSNKKIVGSANKSTNTIGVSPKLRGDRRALIVYFSNLQNASSVSYSLIYKTNGQQEGAMGALSLNGSTQSTELLFGTCSKNVCRYHSGITDARLEVSYTLKNSKKYLKKYKINI